MPVVVGLLGLVFLILALVVDRAWVNYQLQLARQTADLAAEAAAGPQGRTIWSTVTVKRVHWDYVPVESDRCADPGPDTPPEDCLEFEMDTVAVVERDVAVREGEQSLFQGDWRSQFNCGAGGYWTCESFTVVEEVQFHSTAPDLARQVFLSNWQDGTNASAQVSPANVVGTTRTATVSLDLRIKSLFGLFTTGPIPIQGTAVVQYQHLVLQ